VKNQETIARRSRKVKAKILRKARPRISVYRSLKHIEAQIIDDRVGKTLVAFSDKKIKEKNLSRTEKAEKVGEELGKLAKSKKILKVSFDRGAYAYHGRVKALAGGLRKAGLEF
jgi:large subunit ribosomal protein L18